MTTGKKDASKGRKAAQQPEDASTGEERGGK